MLHCGHINEILDRNAVTTFFLFERVEATIFNQLAN
jgi:hypothetical protein